MVEFIEREDERVLTAKEVAWFLKVDVRVVRDLIKSGNLKGFKLGRDWRVQVKHLKEYMGG